MKISLLIVCTNRYLDLIPQLLESADKHFLQYLDVEYCIFTDRVRDARKITKNIERKCRILEVERKEWPHATLNRFHFFRQHKEQIKGDYIFYIDADSKFFSKVGEEIFGDLVATQHCGFVGERGTYETRMESAAYVPESEGTHYFVGSFFGASSGRFWQAVDVLIERIDKDYQNDITAVWWDESHWNRYLIDNPPTLILSPEYHFPGSGSNLERWIEKGIFFWPRIIALKKSHDEIRDI